ncbi:MAG: urease subunit gamma [Gaiellaceae bacterium]
MQLSPREVERLQIFTAAELARRRLRDGVELSHPEAIALASDEILEAARRGATFEEARDSVRGILTAAQLLSGVPELLEAPHQVEALFGDGSRLVPIVGLVSP